MATVQSNWNKDTKLITTQISGDANMDDVRKWERSLEEAMKKVGDNGAFKIFVNLHGFKAVNFDVHKAFREIVPRRLSRYGWRVGYLDMFPEAAISLTNERGIQCKAAVHVHHDESKIGNYDKNYSRPNERFFTDTTTAEEWINNIDIDKY